MNENDLLFEKAKKFIPGGVNSPVRSFNSVGINPVFIEKSKGAYLYDILGNKYIDYVCSWGPMILGHNDDRIKEAVIKSVENGLSYGAVSRIEVEIAELICSVVPSVDMIRMVNSGTEATMSALRLARGYTGKNKIIKFEGCYHGHSDSLLIKAGSGAIDIQPDSNGITKNLIKDTLVANYNDLNSVEELFSKFNNEIACIIVEPVCANIGVVLPEDKFLQGLRNICNKNNALLIFDEVITGFRLGITGASGYFNIKPDLITYGKIIGGGMPVGAYGGSREIMKFIAPSGNVYQAGTLSGNPIAMTAGLTQLKILSEDKNIYTNINNLGDKLFNGIKNIFSKKNIEYKINHVGSIGSIFFTKNEVKDYKTAKNSDIEKYKEYFKYMFHNGIYLAPSQFEAMFISNSHTNIEIEKTLNLIENIVK